MGSQQGSVRGSSRPHRLPEPGQGGYALIYALMVSVMIVGMVGVSSMRLLAHRKDTELDHARHAQATQLARSGLTEALGWFRKQSAQPVVSFEPRLDPGATPPLLETDDPDIGLVRDFAITGAVWGRYEVWREWAADPDAERLAWRERIQTQENSVAHHIGAGGSWMLRSVGFVYVRNDPNKRHDEHPNRVIASEMLETEIRRLSLTPPGQAAINARRGAQVTINTNGRVFGGSTGAGIYYPTSTGTPADGGAGSTRVTGTPAMSASSSYDDSYEAVFGVGANELRSMADDIVTSVASLPVPVPENALIFIESPSIHLDSSTPLSSTDAIVVARGNVVLEPGNASMFTGLLYVDGNLTVRAPCEFKGSIIVTGTCTVQGAADFADVYFDDDALNRLRQHIGNYRVSAAMRRPAL